MAKGGITIDPGIDPGGVTKEDDDMAVIVSQKIRIQQWLVAYFKARSFPVVSYDADGSPADIDSEATPVAAAITPILCNEVTSLFSPDERYRRGEVQERAQWTFALRLRFNQEVLLEFVEEDLAANPPLIEKSGNLPPVILRLAQTQVDHPVQQQSSTGTEVEFTFEAEQGRR